MLVSLHKKITYNNRRFSNLQNISHYDIDETNENWIECYFKLQKQPVLPRYLNVGLEYANGIQIENRLCIKSKIPVGGNQGNWIWKNWYQTHSLAVFFQTKVVLAERAFPPCGLDPKKLPILFVEAKQEQNNLVWKLNKRNVCYFELTIVKTPPSVQHYSL